MPGKPLPRRKIHATTLAVLVAAGCAAPPPYGPVIAPSRRPATTTACAIFPDTQCAEWTPLDPQPSFAGMLALEDSGVTAAPGISWSGLYLCGAVAEDGLRRHLGDGHVRAIIDGYRCVHSSADGARSLSVHLAAGSFQKWATSDRGSEKKLVSVHGSDIIVVRAPPSDTHIEHESAIRIPEDDQVLAVDIDFHGTPPNPWAAKTFTQKMQAELVALTRTT